MDRLDVGHYVRSKPGVGQPQIEGYIYAIDGDVARIDTRRVGGAKLDHDPLARPIIRVRSLRNLERSEL